MHGRDCVTAAAVMGNQVLLAAIPMEAMDLVVDPRLQRVVPNPENPNIPGFLAKSTVKPAPSVVVAAIAERIDLGEGPLMRAAG